MNFSFYSKEIEFIGELIYIRNEYALSYKPFCTNVNAGILFGAGVELNVIRETNEIVHISGFNPMNTWVDKIISPPKAKKGCLLINLKSPLLKGECIEYDTSCLTYYDKEKQYICIGDYDTNVNDDCVEFANNIIAVLRDGAIIAVWAKIREV